MDRSPDSPFQPFRYAHLWRENPLINSLNAEEEKKVRETVANFLRSSINIANLKDDDDLFESGIVNSLFAVQLMTFLERTFALEIGMDDLDIENFKSLNATTAFVMRKKGRQTV
jgi:methoxymalonate biosynthesis acyl carrier protein